MGQIQIGSPFGFSRAGIPSEVWPDAGDGAPLRYAPRLMHTVGWRKGKGSASL